jgi:hypothetical protein
MSKLFGEGARVEADADFEGGGVSWALSTAARPSLVADGVVNVVGERVVETGSCAVGVASAEGEVMDLARDGGHLTALTTPGTSPDVGGTFGVTSGDEAVSVSPRGSTVAVEVGVTMNGST